MKKFLLAACLLLLLSGNSWALDASTVTVDVLAKTTASWNGATLPSYPTGQPEVTILKISIPPHVQLPFINIRLLMPVYCCKENSRS